MVALIIAITIMMILIGAALPFWSRVTQREKETELIFRGQQYVEAIRLFQKRNGRLPMKLEELIKANPRCIRKLWKDPITNSDDWGLVYFGQGARLQPHVLPQDGANPRDVEDGRGGGIAPNPEGGRNRGTPAGPLPIVGVHSKSPDKSIRSYQGRERYDEWLFSIQDQQKQVPGGMPGGPGGRPGGKPGGTGTGGR